MVYYFSLPRTLFQEPYSTVIESKEGELLGAKIALDGQWRFPAQDSVPDKFKKCIVYFEDEYFYKHPGFNPVAMVIIGKTKNAKIANRFDSKNTKRKLSKSRAFLFSLNRV